MNPRTQRRAENLIFLMPFPLSLPSFELHPSSLLAVHLHFLSGKLVGSMPLVLAGRLSQRNEDPYHSQEHCPERGVERKVRKGKRRQGWKCDRIIAYCY